MGNRWNILGFNFTKRDAQSSVYKISMGGWLSGGMWAGRLYIPQLYDKKRPCSRANENGENYKPARPPVICIAQWLTTKSGSIGSSAKFNTNFLLTEFY